MSNPLPGLRILSQQSSSKCHRVERLRPWLKNNITHSDKETPPWKSKSNILRHVSDFRSDWKLINQIWLNLLRRFYTRRNVSRMSRRHRFFCSCKYLNVLFTDTFLKCQFRWKVEMISTFPLWTNVTFFLNQSFLCIRLFM